MIIHDKEQLVARGFTPLREMCSDAASWELRRIAMDTNTRLEDISAFRLESGWMTFLRPGKQAGSGFKDEPILSKT